MLFRSALVNFSAGTKRIFCTAPTQVLLPNQTGNSGKYLTTNGTAPSWSTVSAGTVTSVGLSLPAIFTVTNSPVTSSGTLTGTLATQTANYIWAGPTTGAAAAPTFRALVAGDIPALPYASYPGAGIPNSTGTAWGTSYRDRKSTRLNSSHT